MRLVAKQTNPRSLAYVKMHSITALLMLNRIKSAVIECIFTYARLRGFCLFRILYLPLKISNLPTKMIFSFRSGKVRILAKKYPQMWLRSKIWMRAFKPPRLKSHLGIISLQGFVSSNEPNHYSNTYLYVQLLLFHHRLLQLH